MFFVLLKLVTVRQSNLPWLKGYRASPSIWRVRASATDSAALRDIMKGQNNNNGGKKLNFHKYDPSLVKPVAVLPHLWGRV